MNTITKWVVWAHPISLGIIIGLMCGCASLSGSGPYYFGVLVQNQPMHVLLAKDLQKNMVLAINLCYHIMIFIKSTVQIFCMRQKIKVHFCYHATVISNSLQMLIFLSQSGPKQFDAQETPARLVQVRYLVVFSSMMNHLVTQRI